jgi:GAF domain-containing protein
MNKWLLIEAERNRIRGKKHRAGRYYKQAIDLSKEHRFLPEEALANELLAKHCLASEENSRAKRYLEQALKLYEKWGASARIYRLLETYRALLVKPDINAEAEKPISTDTENCFKASPINLAEMGLRLFSECLNSISNEADAKIYLLQLSKNIMHYTGAQRVLLLLNFNPLTIGVDHQVGKPPQALIPIQKDTSYPNRIIQYVLRTQADLLIDNASQSDMFASDAYVQEHQVKSVICIPLIFQGRLSTILYLENNVSIGVFPPRLRKLLKGLSNQIALLLEHEALKKMQSQYPATAIGAEELKAVLQAEYGLTTQETKIALLLKDGYARPQISEVLHISTQTLRKHMQKIYDKTVNLEGNFTSEGRVDKLSRLILFLFKIESHEPNTNPNRIVVDSGWYLKPD